MNSSTLAAFALGAALTGAAIPLLRPAAPAGPLAAALAASPAQDQQMSEMMKEMFEKARKFIAPGEAHKALAPYLGKWDCVLSMSMGPGAPAMTSKFQTSIDWLVDGRFLKVESKGEMMGQPYYSFGFMGYDNFKQAYVSSWVDNMNTWILSAQGKLAQDGKTMILYGLMDEYTTGEVGKMVKYVRRWKDADHFVEEVHDLAIGEENTKVVEIAFARSK